MRFHIKHVIYGCRFPASPVVISPKLSDVLWTLPAIKFTGLVSVAFALTDCQPVKSNVLTEPELCDIKTRLSFLPPQRISCVWSCMYLLPPVFSDRLNDESESSTPTGTRPEPHATHVPTPPNAVLTCVAVACDTDEYIAPTG